MLRDYGLNIVLVLLDSVLASNPEADSGVWFCQVESHGGKT